LNLSAIFSKTGKGVQEASGKTSHLSRADRAVLSAIDGKTRLSEVHEKFEKLAAPKFEALIQQLDKDGFIREVSSGSQPAAPTARPAAPAAKSAPSKADDGDDMDFTQAVKLPPKAPASAAPKPPQVDLAAAARADAERKAKEQQALDYRGRQEVEAKAKAEAEAKARAAAEARAKADAESKARAAAEATARAEAEARARAEADAKTHAEADAKVKAAREAAVRMATEVKAKAEAEARATASAAAEREREALDRARREAEDKARLEADLNAKLEAERKAREDAERRAAEAGERARKELAEKAKRDAEELRLRLEAEMKAKLDEERKAREEEDRKRREEDDRRRAEEDRKRREADERRRKEDEERRAKEEAERAKDAAERRAREEEDRKRREEDERRRKADEERRAKDDAERRARDEADRKKRDEEERGRRHENERRAKEEAERRAKDDAERRARDEADARARAAQAAATSASLPSIDPVVAPPPPSPPPAAAAGGGIGDDLLADLDSFGKREEEEQRAKEEAERKAKAEAERRAKEAAESKAREEADKKRRDEEERRRREEEERRAQEEAERNAREDEERLKQEEADRKRKAKEALAAKQAAEKAARAAAVRGKGAGDDDIGVTDDDLDMDDVKRDQKALAERARKLAREQPAVVVATGRPRSWGKPAAIGLSVLLVGGVGVLHVMPVSTADYEKAAAEALGAPVKIASARLSLITGIQMNFEGVSIGDAVKIRHVRGFPEVGSLFGARKAFNRVELDGVSLSQAQLADAVLGKAAGANFRIGRVEIRQANLEGALKLPPLDVDALVSGDGSLQSLTLRGPDKLSVQLSPKGSEVGFEISAESLAIPFVPALTLSEFSMKGTANRQGVTSSEFDGRAFDGVIGGSARIRWGSTWTVEGEVRSRGVKVAVFAPALVSEGKVDGRGAYTMAGSTPAKLFETARLQGEFKIEKGVLGSFDLTRALQTGGAQTGGRTIFSELTGQGVYDKGAVQITNVAIAAGAMNAGASINVDASGGLSGRILADVKTPNQTLRATLNVSGKLQDPVIRK